MMQDIYEKAFRRYNAAIIASIKANPETSVIRASGSFEKSIENPANVEIKGGTFRKYTVPYAPYIDSGVPKGTDTPVQDLYDWLAYRKYDLNYKTDAARWSIAHAIAKNHKENGSYKFRNPDERSRIIDKALKDARPVLDRNVQDAFVIFVQSEVQQEIEKINQMK
jgi:hypothetical protein